MEGLFYDNPSILKFWHAITFLSYCYLPIYSETETTWNKDERNERITWKQMHWFLAEGSSTNLKTYLLNICKNILTKYMHV